jgi:hypothetical protein
MGASPSAGSLESERQKPADSDGNGSEPTSYAPLVEVDRAPPKTRLRVLLGLSILAWLAVGLIVVGLGALLRLL